MGKCLFPPILLTSNWVSTVPVMSPSASWIMDSRREWSSWWPLSSGAFSGMYWKSGSFSSFSSTTSYTATKTKSKRLVKNLMNCPKKFTGYYWILCQEKIHLFITHQIWVWSHYVWAKSGLGIEVPLRKRRFLAILLTMSVTWRDIKKKRNCQEAAQNRSALNLWDPGQEDK